MSRRDRGDHRMSRRDGDPQPDDSDDAQYTTDNTQAGPARPIPALRGAVTFLTRIPIPGGERADWHAFRRAPWTMPVIGAMVGGIAGLAFLAPSPWTAATLYLVGLYLIGGITHADGLADLGDALAVHGPERRVEVLKDSSLGVGGTLALVTTLIATTLGAIALATGFVGGAGGAGTVAFRIVLAAEVGAKVGMALLVCLGSPAHEGLGASMATAVGPLSLVPVVALSATVLLAPPAGALPALFAALLAGPTVGVILFVRVRPWLGGISGDVLGAANELGRAVALHAGVIAWTIL